MKQIRRLAQYYVDLMVKLGIIRFSLLLASALVVLAIVVQVAVTMLLQGSVASIDVVRSVFFGLLITPWAVYFLSVVVEQLEESRQRLSRVINKLEEMRCRDLDLNEQLQKNIEQLNQEMAERERAEQARAQVMDTLQVEISQREQTQSQLSQQSTLLRSFLDASPDLLYYRSEHGQFLGCNRAMELLLGRSEKQLIGLTPWEVYSSDIAEKVMETDEKVFQHNVSLTYEQWLIYPDGRKACFELRKVPFFDRDGKRHGLVGFGRDITERKRYQDALESASREKTTFISTISHELRTPLNGIVGLSRMLLDTELNPKQLQYLKTLHVSAITLGNIFNDIIEMDRLERRKIKLDRQTINLADFLCDLENLSQLLVEPKGLNFQLISREPLPTHLYLDGTRLRQILWNLIGNAVKFTQQGGVEVRVAYLSQERLEFQVQDTGIGIPEEEQDRIFAMYYQVTDQKGGRSATGTGIGLAVSRRLAQIMGGDITVTSRVGQGACFTVTVGAPAVDEVLQKSEDTVLPLPALRILLVEDIELNVIVARSVLEKLGSCVEVAMTGQEALQMFLPGKYDLVLLDIQLPDITGFQIAQRLRENFHREALPPLVALTANVSKNKQEYLESGMDDVLSKPLSVPALTTMIRRFWHHQDQNNNIKQESEIMSHYKAILDIDMLEQYLDLVGVQVIEQSLELFEKMMPSYLSLLDSNMMARDETGITQEAHKIKGAAGSVGLRHLQQIAQQIQTPSLPAWSDNVQEWVDELKSEWRNDVSVMREWLQLRGKK